MSKEKRDLHLTFKCLPRVFVDYKEENGDFIVEKPLARGSRYTFKVYLSGNGTN